jgi:nitroimidazol reductase NimA-like FMN-containing flavoprotein (pyridoxamine 5'-phosphate oxidase superfamily)
MSTSWTQGRRKVRMTDAEIREMLERGRSLQLATNGEDGTPHLSTLWYGLRGDDLVAWTPAESTKGKNLKRDQRAAWLLEDGATYEELRGVLFRGHVELVEDAGALLDIANAIFERNFRSNRPDPAERIAAGGRLGMIFRPSSVASWDHRKLAATRSSS